MATGTQVAPPSVDVETEMPDNGTGPEKTWNIEEYWNRVALEQLSTGSPERMLKRSGPGFRKPRSLKVVALINREAHRKVDCPVDYACFELEKEGFVAGYGLGFEEQHRGAPFIGFAPG